MSKINWRDGGGVYPPGSDTANAPWNEIPDPEPNENEYDLAREEIYPFLNFEPEATTQDINNAVPILQENGKDDIDQLAEICDACDKPNPLLAINDELKAEIIKQAQAYVEKRAYELAAEREPDFDEPDFDEAERYPV